MKKVLIMTLTALFASSLAFAQRAHGPDFVPGGPEGRPAMHGQRGLSKEDMEAMKAKREEMGKDRKEMETLVEKYGKEKDAKKKAAIEAEVKAKVGGNYDKHIVRMEERVKDSEDKLEKAKEMLAESKKPENKEKHVEKVTKKILSGEKPTLFGPPNGGDKAKGAKGGKAGKKYFRNGNTSDSKEKAKKKSK
jgi:Cu/Ag efflux pump CusA